MSIIHNENEGKIWIGQLIYTENLLRKFSLESCKPAKVPMDPSETFKKSTDLDEQFDEHFYRCNWKSDISVCHYET